MNGNRSPQTPTAFSHLRCVKRSLAFSFKLNLVLKTVVAFFSGIYSVRLKLMSSNWKQWVQNGQSQAIARFKRQRILLNSLKNQLSSLAPLRNNGFYGYFENFRFHHWRRCCFAFSVLNKVGHLSYETTGDSTGCLPIPRMKAWSTESLLSEDCQIKWTDLLLNAIVISRDLTLDLRPFPAN